MCEFTTSYGESLHKANVTANRRVYSSVFISDAVRDKKVFCWACGLSWSKLAISSIVSLEKCVSVSKTELSWDTKNFQLECLKCMAETEKGMMGSHKNYNYKMWYINNFNQKVNRSK